MVQLFPYDPDNLILTWTKGQKACLFDFSAKKV
jgi:hypothetical protein